MPGKRALDLDAHEIGWIVEAAASGRILRIQPSMADEGEHDVAAGDARFDRRHVVDARLDVVDVDEHGVGAERGRQRVVNAARISRAVVSTVVDEDSGHADIAGRSPRVVPTAHDYTGPLSATLLIRCS